MLCSLTCRRLKKNVKAGNMINVNDASLLSVQARWPLSLSETPISLKVLVFREWFSSTAQPPANFKSTETWETMGERWEERGGERETEGESGVFWGTQQGHLPGAIWWWRWFYTVVFVCLFRLRFLPESASGQPSVIIELPPSASLSFFFFFCVVSLSLLPS